MARALGFGTETGIDLPTSERLDHRPGYKVRDYERQKDYYCGAAKDGYPEEADRARAAYLTALAKEYCADGFTLQRR